MRVIDKFLRALREINVKNSCLCDGCSAEVFDYPNTRLCAECSSRLLRNDGFRCEKCGRATRAEGVCNACKSAPPDYEKGASALVYFDKTAALVNRFKNGKRYMAEYFSEELLCAIGRLPAREYVLVSVPLTKRKLRERGYNQSSEIVIELAKRTGFAYRTDLLDKRAEDSQKSLSATERRKNIIGAFRVQDRKFCKGKDFLVVDDIMTSGATTSEIAIVLLRAGANSVCALTVSAVPDRDLAGE